MKKALLMACLTAGTFLGALDAHAYVVIFDQLAHNDDQFVEHGATYTVVEGGFRFANTATAQSSGFDPSFATAGTQLTGIYPGSTALFNDNDNGQTVLTRVDGGTFNLNAISLAELLPGNPVTVTFIGTLNDTSTVTQSFTLDGNPGAENFTFNSNFSNLVSVSWVNGANYHQFDNVDATPTLISFTVTTTANNGTITSTPNPTVIPGATTTVTGSANPGYYFTGVSGCGGTAQNNTNQSVTTFQYTTGLIANSCTVTANFSTVSSYTVTTTANNGTITSTPNPTVDRNTSTTVTGSADTGYYFTGVSGCGGTAQSNTDQSVTTFQYATGLIANNCTVTANFSAVSLYTVTTTANNGKITSKLDPTVIPRATTIVTGSADKGYYFADVSGCGGLRQANMDQSRTTFLYTTGEITSSCTVTANFASGSPHTITTSAGTHGTISQSQTVGYGLDANITITPNPHYNVADVLVDGKPFDGKVSGNTYTIPEVTALHTISAAFILQGDVNGDGSVDLQDAIAAMRLLSNIPLIPSDPPVHKAAGVGVRNRIGIADVIFILQTVAALRQ